jgi:hypothetical protein
MNINLFRLALDRLEPSDWAHFERICSAFLLSEFSALPPWHIHLAMEGEIRSCSPPTRCL